MGNANTTEAPIAGGVNDMECKLIIDELFHLVDNRTADYLLYSALIPSAPVPHAG